ncbi:hypothetical protein PoB_006775000 [Plakobranchus ocellatus]|uniref:Uncharacterized protein n=1 Tax=Plakobranchus ocellatus TaxID=259542 RepID=A0AAV4DAW7_9GAST|nr:hypothetical protein PoB_006775000 [Plakobranchus ocellatus]
MTPAYPGWSPPRRRMRVEISQHEKRLRKLLQRVQPERVSKMGYWEEGTESKRLESFQGLLWQLQHAGQCSEQFLRNVPFRMRRAASPAGDPSCGRGRV